MEKKSDETWLQKNRTLVSAVVCIGTYLAVTNVLGEMKKARTGTAVAPPAQIEPSPGTPASQSSPPSASIAAPNTATPVVPEAAAPAAASEAPTRDIDFGPYMAETQRRIKKNWKPPSGVHSVQVIFKVHQNGKISDVHLKNMVGDVVKDLAAMKAVMDTQLPPLPEGSPDSVDIQMTFDWKLVPGKNP